MPIAYQEQAQLTCPACGADFEAPVWLILDAQEQPEAAEALRRGELNEVACPACGTSGPAGAPLLFHDGAARRVIFAAAPGAQEHEIRDQARDLHALLVGSIPEELRRPYLADVDIAQDLAGIAHLLRRMDSRRRRESPGGAARPAPAAEPEQPSGARAQASDAPPPLLVAVQAMLGADSAEELDRVLAAYPILLDASTDATLAQLADVAVEQRAYEIADSLRRAREILAQMGGATPARQELPPDVAVTALPEPALQALLQSHSAAELAAAAEAHPLLLRPEVDALLTERVNLALDEGNERMARAVEERREALAELRAAAAATAAPADGATLDEAIEALLVAEGEDAMAEVLDRYPILLDEAAAQALFQFAAEARASGDEELAGYAVACREMLRRVRAELEQ
jgi:hypothetical protein